MRGALQIKVPRTKQSSASLILAVLFSLQVTFQSLKSLYQIGSPCALVSLQELHSHQKETILLNSPCSPFQIPVMQTPNL